MQTRRKQRASVEGGIHTIPELKRKFDTLQEEVAEILKTGEKESVRVKRFQQVWRKLFGRPVDKAAAEAYLQVKARSRHRVSTTRRNTAAQKQKGGMAPLAGAPLDYQTRPGIDGTYGSFLPYVGPSEIAKFDAVTTQDAFASRCGMEDSTPKVAASMGSNLVSMEGGALAGDLAAYWSGRPAAASPDPSQKAFKYL